MAADEAHPVNDSIVRSIFRHKARKIARKAGMTAEDVADLESEILLQFIRRCRDTRVADPRAFAVVIADHAVADWLRHRKARKRDDSSTASLNAPVAGPDDSSAERGDLVGQDELDARRCVVRRDAADAADLALDVTAALESLPPQLRDLAERQRAGHSLKQIAADLKVPRTTVNGWVAKLRHAFGRAGLDDYL